MLAAHCMYAGLLKALKIYARYFCVYIHGYIYKTLRGSLLLKQLFGSSVS